MKTLLAIIIIITSGCSLSSPVDAIHNNGGHNPIICYRPHRFLQACRDAGGTFWICDGSAPVECMRADEPARLFSVPGALAEAPK